MVKHLFRTLWHLPRRTIIGAISIYQQTLSPDHGPLKHLYPHGFCRHEPTCSEYGKQVLTTHGVALGIPLLLWRLLHCNPWAPISDSKLKKMAMRASQKD